MDCKKDKIGNFERGYSQSNHRKVTDFGLLQDFKRMIMTFDSRVLSINTREVNTREILQKICCTDLEKGNIK